VLVLMSIRSYRAQLFATLAVLVVVCIGIGITFAFGFSSSRYQHNQIKVSDGLTSNGNLTVKQATHTECRAERSSALTSAQFAIIFGLLGAKNATSDQIAAAGQRGAALPDIDTLVTQGGDIPVIRNGVTVRILHFGKCPPSVVGASVTTTSGG
jgi:hypothetical protein